jgi:predicted unusual protein kinase regulating ubiquinone biosynthesis (AarF/ABC1/UbiB family)
MFTYINKLYNQIKNLYNIKTHIDNIYKTFQIDDTYDTDDIDDTDSINNQLKLFESLKKLIFDSGSLYIKFFQWYISKLKSTIIHNDITIIDSPEKKIEIKNTLKFINYFEDIFEQCPYHTLEHTINVFKESMYGISIEDYVDISTLKAIASGSIGQVYYAKRKRDGIDIAIKVKHPNIETDLENQYELIKLFKIIQSISYLRAKYNLLFNIDDFLEDINLQCDFNNEANNTNIFIENFKDSSHFIVFPEPLYQSKDLLISKYIEGNSINNLTDMQKYQTSLNFVCFFKQMLFVDNFIHGDLHCKNWKVRYNEETKNIQMIVYDCGICFKNIYPGLTHKFWLSLINYDIEELLILLKEFIKNSNDKTIINFDDESVNKKFDNDIRTIFKEIIKKSMGTSIVMNSILNFFRMNNIIIHKFLLNFTILVCVIEEYMKSNNLIDKNINKNVSMFDVINDCQFDIIAFCDVKKCYPKLKQIFEIQMKDNFKTYKNNNEIHKLEFNVDNENKDANNTNEIKCKKLFSSISLSGLTFKPPV